MTRETVSPRPFASVRRGLAIARNTFRELLRDRVLYIIGIYALILVASLRVLPELSAGSYPKIFLDLSLASLEILALFLVAFVSTRSLEKEVEQRTMLVLASKPISRGELVVGKFVGLWSVAVAAVVLMGLVTVPIAALGQVAIPVVSYLLSLLFFAIELLVLTAAAMLFGSFAGSLLASLMTLGVYLMGNFSEDLLRLGETTEGAGVRQLTQVLFLLLPNLASLDLKNDAVYGTVTLPDVGTLLLNGVYGIAYALVLLGLAIAVFQRRQF